MKPLVAKMALILAVFLVVLLFLGSGFGQVEIGLWFAALVASLAFVVQRYRIKRNS
ncbi:hypothetical protein SUDANB70_04174 [Streptomyces sp. enrichment culture]